MKGQLKIKEKKKKYQENEINDQLNQSIINKDEGGRNRRR